MSLTNGEIIRITTKYIGVASGYLGDFSYSSHRDFYPEYCELDIDPEVYEGTTRQRFIEVLKNSEARVQARILRGVLAKYPVLSSELRTVERADWMQSLIARLETTIDISLKVNSWTPATVQKAISDAEVLIGNNGFASAVDRMHTALHGYLISICDSVELVYDDQPSLTYLFRLVWNKHPAFQAKDSHAEQIVRILRSFTGAINALNELRNDRSFSHPNELLPDAEAALYINSIKTLFAYLDIKLTEWYKHQEQQSLPDSELEVPF